MTKNELSLEISGSYAPKIMRMYDTSHYCDDVLENYMVEVLPVNKSKWVVFYVKKNFSVALNSSNLGYKSVSRESQLVALPDGIYEFKQSHKPNIHTVTQFYHLRIVDLKRKLQTQWDKLISDTCKISREEFAINRDRLRDIDEYTSAAKWQVEECNNKAKGKELYDFSCKLLERYTNECRC